jgi:hypothetical protein
VLAGSILIVLARLAGGNRNQQECKIQQCGRPMQMRIVSHGQDLLRVADFRDSDVEHDTTIKIIWESTGEGGGKYN